METNTQTTSEAGIANKSNGSAEEDRKFFIHKCKDLEKGIDEALDYFPIDNRTLIGYEMIDEGQKKFKLFGSKEPTYKFFIKPIYKSLLLPFLIEIIRKAGLSLYVKVSFREPLLRVTFSGRDQALLTKDDNELLHSFEHLVRIYLYKRVILHEGIKFIVRADRNAQKTEEELKKLAASTKAKVIENQESVTLKPLSPSDRRIIHQYFQDDLSVQTTSLGDGRFKQIEISLR